MAKDDDLSFFDVRVKTSMKAKLFQTHLMMFALLLVPSLLASAFLDLETAIMFVGRALILPHVKFLRTSRKFPLILRKFLKFVNPIVFAIG